MTNIHAIRVWANSSLRDYHVNYFSLSISSTMSVRFLPSQSIPELSFNSPTFEDYPCCNLRSDFPIFRLHSNIDFSAFIFRSVSSFPLNSFSYMLFFLLSISLFCIHFFSFSLRAFSLTLYLQLFPLFLSFLCFIFLFRSLSFLLNFYFLSFSLLPSLSLSSSFSRFFLSYTQKDLHLFNMSTLIEI